MELILLEKVRNLGNLGDSVKVKAGYGRNFLIPQGKAVPANEENRAYFEQRRADLEQAQSDKLASSQARAEQMSEMSVAIARKVGAEDRLFGSVNAQDIAEAVTAAGVTLNRQEVRLPEGPLRSLGEFEVAVHLHTDVETTVKVHVVSED